jgi:hypothetical protein
MVLPQKFVQEAYPIVTFLNFYSQLIMIPFFRVTRLLKEQPSRLRDIRASFTPLAL